MSQLIASASPRAVVAELKRAGPLRVAIGTLGVITIGYAALRILQDTNRTKPLLLLEWLVGALIIHDGVIAPLTVAIGWAIARYVPRSARPFVQSGLAIAGVVVLFALPFIYRQGESGPGSALLKQNYVANLLLILAVITAATVALYVLRVVRERPNSTKERPPAVHEPIT
ncbi:MAG: hypothetical protein JWM76_1604 [Pseudonocardiales bacterium]|nr:hypothetical protein [Pseudonocardiales bacterium]